MDMLVRLALWLRSLLRRSIVLVLTVALGVLVVWDARAPLERTWALAAVAAWFVILASRISGKVKDFARPAGAFGDFEVGCLLVVGAAGFIQRSEGGLSGTAYPIAYALVALVSAFAHPAAAITVAIAFLGLEGAIRYVAFGERDPRSLLVHGGFIVAFSLLNVILLRAEIARVRHRARARVDTELSRIRDAARSYRLLGAARSPTEPSENRTGDEERLVRSSVEEIHQAVLFSLELLKRSLRLHTAILLWQNESGTHARISEVSTDSDRIADGPFLCGDGIIGAVLLRRAPVVLNGLKAGYKLPYYVGACPVRVVCGMPVIEHGAMRGVLLADRMDERGFSAQEVEQLQNAARFVARAIDNERLFVQLERTKVEQGKLYRAAQALGAALTESDVVEAGVRSVRAVALFDFAAVTLFDEASRTHEIRAVSGEGTEALVGARFPHNTSLCAMVVQNRHSLPYKGEFDRSRQVLFSKQLGAPHMPSVLVLPLLVHDRPLGTLVLGAKRRNAFTDAARPTLEVLASHMAVSLANARMVRKLEEMATTDGLTGLLNKRAMLEIAADKIAASRRFSRRMSVLITDIDFFKKVNDTYGHDVGDVVIRGMADVMRRMKRATDAVARFGGEEFVFICEETDANGAMLLAERVRKEVEARTFTTVQGPLKVTCSVGIATMPEAGRDWDALFKAADSALYVSKRSGRNRATAWSPSRKHTAA